MRLLAALLVLGLVALAHADMYLHNPRGSNNRLDEARRDRNNANRLFDSQNNNRGGYNVGSLYYYEGSILSIEWTNQHSCADQNNNCEQILQYTCDDRLRDGATTNTIPENQNQCDNRDCNTDLEYGMHEDYNYYLNCRLRERNMGLYTADRNLQGRTAIYTRQNNAGTRRGYECPEERDYYPYWHPTPWRDIAILTNNVTRCPYYQENSQNVQSRFACILPEDYINDMKNTNIRSRYVIPITQEECNETGGEWTEFPPDPRLSAPECVESQWSRDNHLGNSVGGYPIYYNWTIPNIPHENCALRIRYNISTNDYEAWGEQGVNSSIERQNAQVFDGENGVRNRPISNISSVYEQYFDYETAAQRGYVFRQNPVVKVFPDVPGGNNFGLQLAINTNQFGRTFQDRSHSFAIRSRPADLEGETIYNLNVRGKRGNIVQVYPGVEYDFVPNVLFASNNAYIHVQWTGSNTNPNNNDGQGQAGSDRSNIVLLSAQNFAEGMPEVGKVGHWGNNYPAHLDDNMTFLGWSRADRQSLATLDNVQFGGEMSELDDAGTYFDLGPRKVTQTGIYYYMCSRNNNFTNRGQKGKIIASRNTLMFGRIGWNGGSVNLNNHELMFQRGDLTQPNMFNMEEYADSNEASDFVMAMSGTRTTNEPGNQVSSVLSVQPFTQFAGAQREATIMIEVEDSSARDGTKIYRASPTNGWSFVALDTQIVDGKAVARTNQGGIFVAAAEVSTGVIVGVVIAAVIIILIVIVVIGLSIYFASRPEKLKSTKERLVKTQNRLKRSFAKQV